MVMVEAVVVFVGLENAGFAARMVVVEVAVALVADASMVKECQEVVVFVVYGFIVC